MIVVDASSVVAALIDGGTDGAWAESELTRERLAAPHVMPVESANILRRAVLVGDLSADVAALAYDDLVQLQVDLFPYEPRAHRVWELRQNLTAYDAWYVALAEALAHRSLRLTGGSLARPGRDASSGCRRSRDDAHR